MHSIRIRITAITIAAILTSIVVVFLASWTTIQKENDEQSVENMNLLCRNTQQALETYLDSITQSVEMTANLAEDTLDSVVLVENGVAGLNGKTVQRTKEQVETLDDYLKDYCENLQKSAQSIAINTHGVITYYYCINPEISTREHGFFYSRVGKTGFYEQEPLDARELDPDDLAHTTWYYTPIKRGRPSWVGPYTAHFLGEMWISSYLIPIYKSGALIGVLGMDVSIDTLTDLISPIQVYQSGYASLLDPEGRILYHPDFAFGSKPDLKGMDLNDDLLQITESGEKLIRYTVNGKERQMSFTTLSNGMKLVITAPTSEINASWGRLIRAILITGAVVILVYVILVSIVMNVTTRPLKRLTDAAGKLAAGDYEAELDYQGRDELGVLTKTFSRMRDQIKLQIEDLNRRIYTDSLTGLPNMKYFFELAEQKRDQIFEEDGCPTLLFFDLIGMKHYNRQFGLEGGDQLLCEMAALLVKHFGADCTARLGQDHFAAVIDSEHPEAQIEAFFQEGQTLCGGYALPVRVGIYQERLDRVDASTATDRAKYACDLHRGSYASQYYFFDSSMYKKALDTRYIISHLDQALSEQWIQVFYQPIVWAKDGSISDEECLSRWIDPEQGMFSPVDFIPILEDARMIYKLDLYVLDQALEKMKHLREEGLEAAAHSINLSRCDFDSCDIVEEIRRRVDEAGISRDKIIIEVTESMIGNDFDFMKEQVERFRALGFPVWMDDFGSGYSSLDVLLSIRFDVLKFDMTFMQWLNEGENGKVILTKMMEMAKALGAETVCEGVETIEQIRFLREIGCSRMQGYYFSKPKPLERSLAYYRGKKKKTEET